MSILLRGPSQAADIFTQTGGYPKQRHVFLARFVSNNTNSASTMTFAVKQIDRPTVMPHTEELNQYGKKRFVYTGYKTQPLKVVLYDTADNSSQMMWAKYQRYYFGDFNQINPAMFSGIDIYGDQLNDGVGNYGFTAQNGGATDPNSQYYFARIELLHFYGGSYDSYILVNPRITSFAPDELDYGECGVSTVNIEFSYEALLFNPGSSGASQVPEFQSGVGFNGNPVNLNIPAEVSQGINPFTQLQSSTNTTNTISNLFGSSFSDTTLNNALPDYRYFSNPSSSALGIFGNFSFGSSAIAGTNFGTTISNNLASLAVGNPALAATLNLAYASGANPLASSNTLSGGTTASALPGAQLSTAYSEVSQSFNGATPYGAISQTLTTGITAAGLNGAASGLIVAQDGTVSLDPSALSMINAQRPGMAQYGQNSNITSGGQNYGYNGVGGYSGPMPGLPYSTTSPFNQSVPAPSYPPAAPSVTINTTPQTTPQPFVPAVPTPVVSTPLIGCGSNQSNQGLMQPGLTDSLSGVNSNDDFSTDDGDEVDYE